MKPLSPPSPRRYKMMLMILPVGVVIGTIIFMFMYFYNERKDNREHTVIVSHGLRLKDLDDMVGKFTDSIGVRDLETEQGRDGLRSASSMIEGRLGPQNVGFSVKKGAGEAKHGLLWKSLWVDVRGQSQPERVIIAAVTFSGAGKVADANTVSSMMMLASSMARDEHARTLRFVFLPLSRGSKEQTKWMIENCLEEGELCDGIIGIQSMRGDVELSEEAWRAEVNTKEDQAWWDFLDRGEARPNGVDHAVWVTHPVYSAKAWKAHRNERLENTLPVAAQIVKWLRRAAE